MSDARAKLVDFFSILLGRNEFSRRSDEMLSAVEPKHLSRVGGVTLLWVRRLIAEVG